ncbi:MAG TPA: hypothetical protein VFQ53_29725 [Kofleriaceae bacterium]|nr:hypothetical protein [Kofleriaceae bacterium]
MFLLLAACGGGSNSNPMPDGSTPDDGGPTADAAMPTEHALVQIQLEPPEFSGETPFTTITGGFQLAPDPRCRIQSVGDCVVADCPQALIGGTYADPGRLSFSPALGGTIAFTPGASFLFFSIDQVPWAADESITLAADGATVPAFSLTGKSPRTLDAGEGRSPFGAPMSRTQPFTATWVPTSEQALVVLRQGRDTPNGEFEIIVQCHGPGSSGGLTVPAAALASFLPKASGGLSVEVTAHAMRETKTIAGEWEVTLRVLRSFDQTFFHDVQ